MYGCCDYYKQLKQRKLNVREPILLGTNLHSDL